MSRGDRILRRKVWKQFLQRTKQKGIIEEIAKTNNQTTTNNREEK